MSRIEPLERALAFIFEFEFAAIADHPRLHREFQQQIDALLKAHPQVSRTALLHAIHGRYRLYRATRLHQEQLQSRRTLQS